MLEEIRYSRALIVQQTLAVVKPRNNPSFLRNPIKNYGSQKAVIRRALFEKGEHQDSVFFEKGRHVDYYA